jgi:hypothetical protein
MNGYIYTSELIMEVEFNSKNLDKYWGKTKYEVVLKSAKT